MPDFLNPPFAGDDIIAQPDMLYNVTTLINATPAEIFPWLVQLGKGRGGWYLPLWVERWMPVSWRASRTVKSELQNISVGERHPDYGLSAADYLEVAVVEKDRALVFQSERYGVPFTWALLLHPESPKPDQRARTVVHLRFRGKLAAGGWKRDLVVRVGGFMDHISTAPMLAGLADRLERPHLL